MKVTGTNTPLITKNKRRPTDCFLCIRQMVELSKSQIKFGYIFSSFNDQDDSPLLDSYPKKPSPESNISTNLWIGGEEMPTKEKFSSINQDN